MSKREMRILFGIALLLLLIVVGGIFVVNLQSNSLDAGFRQQRIIETRDAGIEGTATAQAKQP